MPNNLQLYHKVRQQFCQWLPDERITRIRNMALFVTGLYLSGTPHLSKIARKWPQTGKLLSFDESLMAVSEQSQSGCSALVCANRR